MKGKIMEFVAGAVKAYDSKFYEAAKNVSVAMVGHEGVISDTITVRVNGGELHSLKNEPGAWRWLKVLLDNGAKITCEQHLWSGEVKRFDWKGSPSYEYRFGKNGTLLPPKCGSCRGSGTMTIQDGPEDFSDVPCEACNGTGVFTDGYEEEEEEEEEEGADETDESPAPSDKFPREWLIRNAQEVLGTYSEGITMRQLYYRLVARGMTNNTKLYKRLVAAMTSARWEGIVDMEAFIDRERSMYGETDADEKSLESEIRSAKSTIKAWMRAYFLDRWSNQPKFVEVWIEKKALQGVFEGPCRDLDVGLAPCKGYPSLTFLNEAKQRFEEAIERGQEVVILYFGDYDPSGEDIPRSVKENIERMGAPIEVIRIALNPDLIRELRLPGVPPKKTDSRTANWDGNSAVELDAVEPERLKSMCTAAILKHFDDEKYTELKAKEATERAEYQKALKTFVNELAEEQANEEGKDDEGGDD